VLHGANYTSQITQVCPIQLVIQVKIIQVCFMALVTKAGSLRNSPWSYASQFIQACSMELVIKAGLLRYFPSSFASQITQVFSMELDIQVGSLRCDLSFTLVK